MSDPQTPPSPPPEPTAATPPSPAEAPRCGLIAIVGRPNVGKSTLLNALVGQKISITSKKAQTTRHRITGVRTLGASQFIFVDTPGFQMKHAAALNRNLNRTVLSSLSDVDLVLFLVEAGRFGLDDAKVLSLLPAGKPALLIANKLDALTDRSDRFLASEIVREKLFRLTGDELPYTSTVVIDKFEEEGQLRRISATIIVERDAHKGMIIGDGGERLKRIGSEARQELETLMDAKVFLELWVKVRSGWADNEAHLRSYGYE